MVAARIYSNVEENLIYLYKLEHKDKRFIIDIDEYNKILDEYKINGHSILRSYDRKNKKYFEFEPNVIEYEDGNPKILECPPIMRFIKVGMNPEKAKKASDFWSALNKIRHKSPENEGVISRLLYLKKTTLKNFLKEVLEFFKEEQLYTKD